MNRSELRSHAAESGDAPGLFRSSSSNTPTLSWPLNDVSDRDYQIVHSGGQWSRQVRGNLQTLRAFAGSREMQLSQIPKVDASFDEKNLTSAGRTGPDVCGWPGGPAWLRWMAIRVGVPGVAGFDAAAKACSIVAGMLTGADSIDDLQRTCPHLPRPHQPTCNPGVTQITYTDDLTWSSIRRDVDWLSQEMYQLLLADVARASKLSENLIWSSGRFYNADSIAPLHLSDWCGPQLSSAKQRAGSLTATPVAPHPERFL